MILEKLQDRSAGKVTVFSRNHDLGRLFRGILAEWKFEYTDNLAEASLVFVERGLRVPQRAGRIIWLSPMPLSSGDYLDVPIDLTRLYHILEAEVFPSTRRHIRVAMELSADIKIDGEWQESTLLSLSDRGGRLACEHELSKGSKLVLEIKLGGRMLHLQAEVLYAISAGEASGRERPQVGVFFTPLEPIVCKAMRRFIERECLLRACARSGIPINDPSVSWIQTYTDPWHLLDDSGV